MFDISEILLKVELNTINLNQSIIMKRNLNSDGNQFHYYQQSKQWPLILANLTEHNLYHNIWRLKSSSWLGAVTIHVQAKRLFNFHLFIFVRWFDILKQSYSHFQGRSFNTSDNCICTVLYKNMYSISSHQKQSPTSV